MLKFNLKDLARSIVWVTDHLKVQRGQNILIVETLNLYAQNSLEPEMKNCVSVTLVEAFFCDFGCHNPATHIQIQDQ